MLAKTDQLRFHWQSSLIEVFEHFDTRQGRFYRSRVVDTQTAESRLSHLYENPDQAIAAAKLQALAFAAERAPHAAGFVDLETGCVLRANLRCHDLFGENRETETVASGCYDSDHLREFNRTLKQEGWYQGVAKCVHRSGDRFSCPLVAKVIEGSSIYRYDLPLL